MIDLFAPFSPPRDVVRCVEFRADSPGGDGLTLEGYAAVFDQWAEINDWDGVFREQIARGAFRKTIKERTPVLQFDHGRHPLVGSIPLGTIQRLSEDDHGLHVQARLSDNWLVEPVRDAIRDGAISGMSFRFEVIQDKIRRDTEDRVPERTITEVKLHELGPVVFPAYDTTEVGVRSREMLTALADPTVRAELARALTGTPPGAAADDEPTLGHSTRTRNQRRALVALTLLGGEQ